MKKKLLLPLISVGLIASAVSTVVVSACSKNNDTPTTPTTPDETEKPDETGTGGTTSPTAQELLAKINAVADTINGAYGIAKNRKITKVQYNASEIAALDYKNKPQVNSVNFVTYLLKQILPGTEQPADSAFAFPDNTFIIRDLEWTINGTVTNEVNGRNGIAYPEHAEADVIIKFRLVKATISTELPLKPHTIAADAVTSRLITVNMKSIVKSAITDQERVDGIAQTLRQAFAPELNRVMTAEQYAAYRAEGKISGFGNYARGPVEHSIMFVDFFVGLLPINQKPVAASYSLTDISLKEVEFANGETDYALSAPGSAPEVGTIIKLRFKLALTEVSGTNFGNYVSPAVESEVIVITLKIVA